MFIEEVGVKCLSESVYVNLEFVDGLEVDELDIVEKLMERMDVFVRLLYDKLIVVCRKIWELFLNLNVISYDLVWI